MASINGISLKAAKCYESMDGPIWQGNIYVGTKKVAFWSQEKSVSDRICGNFSTDDIKND